MPPAECINCGTCHVPFILTLTIRQTTATPNYSLHQRQSLHPPAAQHVSMKSWHLLLLHASSTIQHPSASTSICKVSSFIFHADCLAYSTSLIPGVNSFFSFQMVALNFERILLMLKDGGSIL